MKAIITRPQHRIELAQKDYQAAGIETLAMSCFAIQTNTEVTSEQLARAERASLLLIFNSNAIKHLLLLKPDFTLSQQTSVMGVGEAVADYWQQHFDHPILTPASQDSAGIIALLEHNPPEELFILTAAGGLDVVRQYCIKQQINYQQINTYQRIPLTLNFDLMVSELTRVKKPVLTATSGLTLKHFWSQCPNTMKPQLLQCPVVCGAKRISDIATSLGFEQVATADSPSNHDMISAVQKMTLV